jgi:hypothetical protein
LTSALLGMASTAGAKGEEPLAEAAGAQRSALRR